MFEGEFETSPAKQQMDGVEALLGLLVGTAVNGRLEFFKTTGFGVGELTRATDT